MGKYNTIRSEMWSDTDFKALTAGGKLLYNYILSSPVSTISGFYKLEILQIKANLCRFNKKEGKFFPEDEQYFIKEILPALTEQRKLWKYDEETEQILIPTYLKYNKIGGSKQLKSIADQITPLTICELHIGFYLALNNYVGDAAINHMPEDITEQVKELCSKQNGEEAKTLLNILDNPF